MPPGKYTLTYSSPNLNCGNTTATVVAGYTTTYVDVICSVRGGDSPVGEASTLDATSSDDSADGG